MLTGAQVIELWIFFKEYMDRKQQSDVVAEKFVDILAEHGIEDDHLKDAMGADDDLDQAIEYYLDIDGESEDY
jgi:hypothetical protein